MKNGIKRIVNIRNPITPYIHKYCSKRYHDRYDILVKAATIIVVNSLGRSFRIKLIRHKILHFSVDIIWEYSSYVKESENAQTFYKLFEHQWKLEI